MIKIMERGTLASRANAFRKITNATLLGSLENEEFTDVEVVTLKQYARDCAHREIMESNVCVLSYEDLEVKVEDLLEQKYTSAKEFISIEESKIVVGINADKVDQRITDKALLMLVEIEDFTPGTFLTFGDPIDLTS